MDRVFINTDDILKFVEHSLMSDRTDLLYDDTSIKEPDLFPTAAECEASYPNPSGYSTGMEDSNLSGGSMLEALILLYNAYADQSTAGLAKRIANGLLKCAEQGTDGFLPRSVSPVDSKSHYKDSSRDQYTIFIYGMHRYLNSKLCTEKDKDRICRAALNIAKRAERNVCPDTDFDMLQEDGSPSLVTKLWGESLGNHEVMRLPMIYMFAYEISGDSHWLGKYEGIIDEALDRSLPMARYWHLYALQQMQVSTLLCYELDKDKARKTRLLGIMEAVAKYAEGMASGLFSKLRDSAFYNIQQKSFHLCSPGENKGYKAMGMPCINPLHDDADDYFCLEDLADVLLVPALAPGYTPCDMTVELFLKAYSLIDLKTHGRNLPVYFLDAYCVYRFRLTRVELRTP